MNQDQLSNFQHDVLREIDEKNSKLRAIEIEQRERSSEIDELASSIRSLWTVSNGVDVCIERLSGHPTGISKVITGILWTFGSNGNSPEQIMYAIQRGRKTGLHDLFIGEEGIRAITETLNRLEASKEVESFQENGSTMYRIMRQKGNGENSFSG